MPHGLLSVGLLTVLVSVYLETHAREPIVRALGAAWSPKPAVRNRINGTIAGCSIALTGLLFMAAAARGGLIRELAMLAAALAFFHATIHVATYRLMLRCLKTGQRVPSRTIDQFLDPRRLSYMDMAAYWAGIFAVMEAAS